MIGRYGCENCKHFRVYPGSYWEPDECLCVKDGPATEELVTRVWENGETWSDSENPLCDQYEEVKEDWND